MSDIPQLAVLSKTPTSLLVWYAKDGRIEFTGPNIYRWLAKTCNYLCEELGEDSQGLLVLDLPPSWRTLFWSLGAALAGVEVSFSPLEVDSADLFVTNNHEVATKVSADQVGLPVLLQEMSPLALGWLGEPFSAGSDAIAEINAQPDGFIYPPIKFVPSVSFEHSDTTEPLFLEAGEANYVELIWKAWETGRRVVWIEPGEDIPKIRQQELG
ncbi:hypothetical protein NXS08_00890 [Gleimia sp. 6138-11-ORH1]|uniref:hypothetical protein n=1 Tax=Gleimia sp. 6138-11-ORH1 TaxID=2973937 RepID=UPI002166D767|nr:hypothetical protein [Gleimia sp. 6138-11-ORH1]MCS4484048.1 hypothetical protein [Gleimia sp. 6138-11-ORH1]